MFEAYGVSALIAEGGGGGGGGHLRTLFDYDYAFLAQVVTTKVWGRLFP